MRRSVHVKKNSRKLFYYFRWGAIPLMNTSNVIVKWDLMPTFFSAHKNAWVVLRAKIRSKFSFSSNVIYVPTSYTNLWQSSQCWCLCAELVHDHLCDKLWLGPNKFANCLLCPVRQTQICQPILEIHRVRTWNKKQDCECYYAFRSFSQFFSEMYRRNLLLALMHQVFWSTLYSSNINFEWIFIRLSKFCTLATLAGTV